MIHLRTTLRAPAVALMAAAVLLAACGGGSGKSSGTATGNDSRIPAGAPFIDENSLRFSPSSLTVKQGEKVYFKNSETALHTVTVNGTNESGMMKGNDVFVWAAPAPGSYRITCDLHPQMRATITVQ